MGPANFPAPFISPIRMGMFASSFMSPDRHIPRLAFAPEPAELPLKPVQEDKRRMPIDAFVSKSCPSLYQPYDPPRWMRKYVADFSSNSRTLNHIPFAAVTSKLRIASQETLPKSRKLSTTGEPGIASGLAHPLSVTPIHRKLLRTVDGGTLYV
jgi:hypothetical protein